MSVYTSGDWHVRPGDEEAFVQAWEEFARWSVREADPTGWARLLRDQKDPRHFISFGRWADQRTVDEWRSSEEFRRNFERIREMTESTEIRTMDIAAEAGVAAVAV